MNKKFAVTLIILLVIVVGAVIYFKKDAVSNISTMPTAAYSNGSATVQASFDTTHNTVTFTYAPLGTVTLPLTISASGARYANQDEGVVFWEHQGELTITKDGAEVFRGRVN